MLVYKKGARLAKKQSIKYLLTAKYPIKFQTASYIVAKFVQF